MRLTEIKPLQTAIVFLHDPIAIEQVKLDDLKTLFSQVKMVDQGIMLEAPEQKLQAQVFSARFQFVIQQGADFAPSDLAVLPRLLNVLPNVNVRAFGINLHIQGIPENIDNAGTLLADLFVRDRPLFEEKLGGRILAYANRFCYGERALYFDVRITPPEIGSKILHFQLHRHREAPLRDIDRIIDETLREHEATRQELTRLVNLL